MKQLTSILFLAVSFAIHAQQPIVHSISPTNVEVGQTVTISGSSFTNVSDVFFGGVEASAINVLSDNLMEATVPAGARQGPITLLNATNDLIGQSSQHFYISFSGSTINNFPLEETVSTTEVDAYDICLCDLNPGDGLGLNDVVITHNVTSSGDSEITIFRNQSTQAATNFGAPTNINNGENNEGFISTTCADLDNDGLPELIFTTNDATNVKHLYVYENLSGGTINMSPVLSLNISLPDFGSINRLTRRIRAADFDGDGKIDLALGTSTDNTVFIYRNTSTGDGVFTFDSPYSIQASTSETGSINVADLNNDNLPDIVALPFDQSSEGIAILRNRSIKGSLSFEDGAQIATLNRRVNIALGDFDNDGFNDLVVTERQVAQQVSIFRNTSSQGGDITFTTGASVTVGTFPWGLDLGDLNGDGKLDIAVASAGNNLYVIENTSTGSGSISFAAATELVTSQNVRNLCVADLNRDAKPDLAFTHDISLGRTGNLGVFMNRNCMEPELSPLASESQFCDTPDNFTLTATASPGASYQWDVLSGNATNNSFSTGTVNSATFEINMLPNNADIRVTITSADLVCTTETAQQNYTIINGAGTTTPTIQVTPVPGGAYCTGESITLSTTASYNNYLWTLPDGSTSTAATIDIASASVDDAGVYSVVVRNNADCSSNAATQQIDVDQAPFLEVFNNGNDTFCSDAANDPQLEVSSITDVTYQWQRNGANIPLATNATYTADQSGSYTVVATVTASGCSRTTSAYTVTEVSEPVAGITGPSETCVNFATTFTSSSTVQTGFTPVNSWIVEDATNAQIGSSSTNELTFTFPAVGTYEVIHTTSYDPTDVASCSDMITQIVTVSEEPVITFNVSDGVEKCQLDPLSVSVTSPDASTIASYSWVVRSAENQTEISTGTGTSIDATTPLGVDSVYVVVTLTTTIGCQVMDSVKVQNFESDIDISATGFDLTNDSVTLEEDNFIVLTADGLVSGVAWSPESIIDDTTSINATVFPATSPTVVTLTGVDANGCNVATTVTIILDNIRPRRTFSPNGDGQGFDCWEILNTSELVGCKVYVFDSRGRNILVQDSPFIDNCVWDGNSNGSPVPEGLYYFVLKCDDSSLSTSGSILLAR